MCPYTKRQTSHRYNALKRGYIIMEDCSEQGGERYNIYYDNGFDLDREKTTDRLLVFVKSEEVKGKFID